MTVTTTRTRKRVDPAEAAEKALELVPDPSAPTAPDLEERVADLSGDVPPSTRVDALHAGPWGAVIDSVISVDPARLFGRLRESLSLKNPGDALTYQVVAIALEEADRSYFDAVLLTRAAKLEEQQVEREIQERMEVLRTSARASVEKEKRDVAKETGSKATGKATLEEVLDRCRANWPDEMQSLERRRDEQHAARAVCEELATAWRSRASSLRELVQGTRSAR